MRTSTTVYCVRLDSSSKTVKLLNYRGIAEFRSVRPSKRITVFKATPAQKKKIKSGKGKICISKKQIRRGEITMFGV